jgi:hypothetical protein
MPGLGPGSHDFRQTLVKVQTKDVDGRDEPGHDGVRAVVWPASRSDGAGRHSSSLRASSGSMIGMPSRIG